MDNLVRKVEQEYQGPRIRVIATDRARKENTPKVKRVIHWPRFLLAIAGLSLALGLLIYILIGYTKIEQLNDQVNSLGRSNQRLQAEADYLQMQIEPFTDKGRIESLAKERLNMSYPSDQQRVVLVGRSSENYQPIVVENPPKEQEETGVLSYILGLFR